MSEQQLFGTNKHVLLEASKGCVMYDPCPICNKCRVKASHLHLCCQKCDVPICVHTHKQRVQMIKRQNFALTVSDDVKEELTKMAQEAERKRRS